MAGPLHALGVIETTRSWLLMAVRLSPTVNSRQLIAAGLRRDVVGAHRAAGGIDQRDRIGGRVDAHHPPGADGLGRRDAGEILAGRSGADDAHVAIGRSWRLAIRQHEAQPVVEGNRHHVADTRGAEVGHRRADSVRAHGAVGIGHGYRPGVGIDGRDADVGRISCHRLDADDGLVLRSDADRRHHRAKNCDRDQTPSVKHDRPP